MLSFASLFQTFNDEERIKIVDLLGLKPEVVEVSVVEEQELSTGDMIGRLETQGYLVLDLNLFEMSSSDFPQDSRRIIPSNLGGIKALVIRSK
jgi:hypothetical protein